MLTRLRLYEPTPCNGFRTVIVPGRHWNIAVVPGEKIELSDDEDRVVAHAQVLATYVSGFGDVPNVSFEHHYNALVNDRDTCSLHIQHHYQVVPEEVTVLHLLFEDLLTLDPPVTPEEIAGYREWQAEQRQAKTNKFEPLETSVKAVSAR